MPAAEAICKRGPNCVWSFSPIDPRLGSVRELIVGTVPSLPVCLHAVAAHLAAREVSCVRVF